MRGGCSVRWANIRGRVCGISGGFVTNIDNCACVSEERVSDTTWFCIRMGEERKVDLICDNKQSHMLILMC